MVLYIVKGISNRNGEDHRTTNKFVIASCNNLTEDDLIKELNTYYEYELKKYRRGKGIQ